jgi:uncharacterized coiled-coil protein SlyX
MSHEQRIRGLEAQVKRQQEQIDNLATSLESLIKHLSDDGYTYEDYIREFAPKTGLPPADDDIHEWLAKEVKND